MKHKTKRITLQEALKEELKDAEFRFYFERTQAVSEIARLVRDARQHASFTQAALAKRAGTSQTVIARVESGLDSRIPSLDLLDRIARALKSKLIIGFQHQATA